MQCQICSISTETRHISKQQQGQEMKEDSPESIRSIFNSPISRRNGINNRVIVVSVSLVLWSVSACPEHYGQSSIGQYVVSQSASWQVTWQVMWLSCEPGRAGRSWAAGVWVGGRWMQRIAQSQLEEKPQRHCTDSSTSWNYLNILLLHIYLIL